MYTHDVYIVYSNCFTSTLISFFILQSKNVVILKAMFLCSGSTVWMNPGFCASANQNHQLNRSQIKTNSTVCLKSSDAAPNCSSQGKNASSSQRPSVGADLGGEWDDWGDFDEENLVHASETSATSCTANHNPQVLPAADVSKPGAVTFFVQLLNLFCKEYILIILFLP